MGMRIHEREQRTRAAALELSGAILDIVKKHDLSEGETIRVVAGEMSNYLQSIAKYMIRDERHGDPEKPGGLEG